MKTEDIDKMIGMPDIDKEWARFEAEVINQKAQRGRRLGRVAAAAVIVLSLGAAASMWLTSSENSENSEYSEISEFSEFSETFVFDNVEMQEIADTLGRYYKVQPVFENEKARHVRLYFQVEKEKSIQEVVALLNHFCKVSVKLQDKKLIIK